MAAPTNEEITLICQFRERLEDLSLPEELTSDMQLVRWLRAREHKLDQAEVMLRKSLKWRKENKIDDILTWVPPEMLTKLLPVDENGFDYKNTPVIILPVGHYDLRGLVQAGYYHETIRRVDQILETTMQKMKGRLTKEGVPVTQFTCIFDMDQLGMRTVGSISVINMIKVAVDHFEGNYPESFRQCYVINSTRIFQILWAIIKPLLSRRTTEKIRILTTESKWKPLLLADIPLNQLPECYGGTEWSKLHSFLGYQKTQDSDTLMANQCTVAAGDTFVVSMDVKEENCLLKWDFTISSHDIDFYVMFDEKEIIAKRRVSSSNQKEGVCGSYKCNSTGIYTFHFDNTHSRFRSKMLKYTIEIEK